MKFEELTARLVALGSTYEFLVFETPNGAQKTRYFMRDGKTSAVDAGDLAYLTDHVIRRVCRELGITVGELTAVVLH